MQVLFDVSGAQSQSLPADLVIGADGASSSVRHLVELESNRTYVGYVAVRGMVPTKNLSERTQSTFDHAGAFYYPEDEGQVVLYTVPSGEEDVQSGTCLNWVWYQSKSEEELAELMTDVNGVRHMYTLPMGAMTSTNAEAIRKKAEKTLAPQVAEAIRKTAQPFAHTITDNVAGKNAFLGGKLLLIGDAAAGQRPHTASALTQASFHALLLKSMLEGQVTVNDWSTRSYEFSSILIETGRGLGTALMTDHLAAPARTQKYMQTFSGTQARLNEKWNESIKSKVKPDSTFKSSSKT